MLLLKGSIARNEGSGLVSQVLLGFVLVHILFQIKDASPFSQRDLLLVAVRGDAHPGKNLL